jgi:hypothetical protein
MRNAYRIFSGKTPKQTMHRRVDIETDLRELSTGLNWLKLSYVGGLL